MTYRCHVPCGKLLLSIKGKRKTNMEYEILDMKEKIAAGLAARTNNASPDMGNVIGGLWQRFYGEGI